MSNPIPISLRSARRVDAEAFRRDLPAAEVNLRDARHFALETHVQEVATTMKEFLA